jgi:hypothetical protein
MPQIKAHLFFGFIGAVWGVQYVVVKRLHTLHSMAGKYKIFVIKT